MWQRPARIALWGSISGLRGRHRRRSLADRDGSAYVSAEQRKGKKPPAEGVGAERSVNIPYLRSGAAPDSRNRGSRMRNARYGLTVEDAGPPNNAFSRLSGLSLSSSARTAARTGAGDRTQPRAIVRRRFGQRALRTRLGRRLLPQPPIIQRRQCRRCQSLGCTLHPRQGKGD
jgi:hypothetical protein